MITLHRSGQYRFFVNSGYTQEQPYICIKQEGQFAKFSLKPVSLTVNNGFSRTEVSRIQMAVIDARDQLLKHWANRSGDDSKEVVADLMAQID